VARRDTSSPKQTDPAELFVAAMGPTAGQEAYGHVVGLRGIIQATVRPPLSQAARAQMDQLGVDPQRVVVDGPDDFVVHNSPERAATIIQERQEALLALVEMAIRHAPQ
jgi:hypothetical protein